MLQHNSSRKFVRIIKNMLDKAECRVKCDGELSNTFDTNSGVLKGGISSPKLFTEYIDDTLISYLLHADDLVLFSTSAEGLQKQIDNYYKYCETWHLIVNNAKSKVLLFNKQYSNVNSYEFLNGNKIIDVTDSYKYLGFPLTTQSHNPFKFMYINLVEQANRAKFAILKSATSSLGKLTPKLSFKVFDIQSLPILEYGCPVWFIGKEIPIISIRETFHLKYIKFTLGVKTQTPPLGVYGDSGRFCWDIKSNGLIDSLSSGPVAF